MQTKIVFFIIMLFCGVSLNGQGVSLVYDARNDVNMANQYMLGLKDFTQLKEQTQVLYDVYDFYKKAREALDIVSKAVEDYFRVQEIIHSRIESVKIYSYYYTRISGFKHLSMTQIQQSLAQLTAISDRIGELFTLTGQILESDRFKMDDASRLQFLNTISDQMADKKAKMKIAYQDACATEEDLTISQFYNRLN